MADTVHIGDSGGESNVVLTASAKKRLKSCKINIIDEEGDEEESDNDLQEGRDFTKYGRGKRNADSNQAFQGSVKTKRISTLRILRTFPKKNLRKKVCTSA